MADDADTDIDMLPEQAGGFDPSNVETPTPSYAAAAGAAGAAGVVGGPHLESLENILPQDAVLIVRSILETERQGRGDNENASVTLLRPELLERVRAAGVDAKMFNRIRVDMDRALCPEVNESEQSPSATQRSFGLALDTLVDKGQNLVQLVTLLPSLELQLQCIEAPIDLAGWLLHNFSGTNVLLTSEQLDALYRVVRSTAHQSASETKGAAGDPFPDTLAEYIAQERKRDIDERKAGDVEVALELAAQEGKEGEEEALVDPEQATIAHAQNAMDEYKDSEIVNVEMLPDILGVSRQVLVQQLGTAPSEAAAAAAGAQQLSEAERSSLAHVLALADGAGAGAGEHKGDSKRRTTFAAKSSRGGGGAGSSRRGRGRSRGRTLVRPLDARAGKRVSLVLINHDARLSQNLSFAPIVVSGLRLSGDKPTEDAFMIDEVLNVVLTDVPAEYALVLQQLHDLRCFETIAALRELVVTSTDPLVASSRVILPDTLGDLTHGDPDLLNKYLSLFRTWSRERDDPKPIAIRNQYVATNLLVSPAPTVSIRHASTTLRELGLGARNQQGVSAMALWPVGLPPTFDKRATLAERQRQRPEFVLVRATTGLPVSVLRVHQESAVADTMSGSSSRSRDRAETKATLRWVAQPAQQIDGRFVLWDALFQQARQHVLETERPIQVVVQTRSYLLDAARDIQLDQTWFASRGFTRLVPRRSSTMSAPAAGDLYSLGISVDEVVGGGSGGGSAGSAPAAAAPASGRKRPFSSASTSASAGAGAGSGFVFGAGAGAAAGTAAADELKEPASKRAKTRR